MEMSNPWFRLYSDFIYDEKIEFISLEDQRHFVFILCMKNLGLIDKEYSSPEMHRVVARRLGLYGEAFDSAKKRLVESALIKSDWQPTNWNKRQFVSDTDPTHAERQRKYRERLKNKDSDVTRDVTVTVLDTESDTDKDIKPIVKASRLPTDWKLSLEYQEAALSIRNIDLSELADVAGAFKDYWIAVPGAKGVKLDWLATWRNWVRRAKTTAAVTQTKPRYTDD